MNPLSPNPAVTPASQSRTIIALAAALLALAGLVSYHNSFSGALVLDDQQAIIENRTIRQLWPPGPVLAPPNESGVGGRPLANLSFALNYAISGLGVGSYHAVNLGLHLLSACTLFGLVRRTFLQPVLRERFGPASLPLAFFTALLWTVHPLQTQVVDYMSQRTEALMALFYLLTLYCFIRGTEIASSSRWWLRLSFAACLLGTASKEIIATVPILVLLYDRTFVAGTFREAWRRRKGYYLALASTWIALAFLMQGIAHRGVGTDGGINPAGYALIECRVILNYLRLSLWPDPLVFDYGRGAEMRQTLAEAAPYVLGIAVFITATAVTLRRNPPLGFVACWLLVILAPTSSVVPLYTQPMAESRMYLPLAAVMTALVLGVHALAGRRGFLLCLALAIGGCAVTLRRNPVYRSPESLWRDTLAKKPSARVHNSLGFVLTELAREDEALPHFEAALALAPDYDSAHNNLGKLLSGKGRFDEAIAHFQQALQSNPGHAYAHNNLGNALIETGQAARALVHFEAAVRYRPDYDSAVSNFGAALLQTGRTQEAVEQLNHSLRLIPDNFQAHYNLGSALVELGQLAEATSHFKDALQLNPGLTQAQLRLGDVLIQQGKIDEGMLQLTAAVQKNPGRADVQIALATALLQLGRGKEAIPLFTATAPAFATNAKLQSAFGIAFAQAGRFPEAIRQFEKAVETAPGDLGVRFNLALALIEGHRRPEAIAQLEQILRMKPDFTKARQKLDQLLASQAGPSRSP